jgi:hypothetical protein
MQLKRDIAPRSFQSRIPRYLQIAGVVYCVTIGLAKQVTSAGARGLRLQMQMLLLVEREDTSASRLACMAEAKGGKYVVTHSPIRVTLPWRTQNHWLPFEYASRSRLPRLSPKRVSSKTSASLKTPSQHPEPPRFPFLIWIVKCPRPRVRLARYPRASSVAPLSSFELLLPPSVAY